MKFSDSFNIPNDIQHDHSPEAFKLLNEGIDKLKVLLDGNHDGCVQHVLKYSELNIRFFFAANLLPDKTILKDAFDIYIKNMVQLFARNFPPELTTCTESGVVFDKSGKVVDIT
jgi:hypothetical protein